MTADLFVRLDVLALFYTWNTTLEERMPTKHVKVDVLTFLVTKTFNQKIPNKPESQWVWIWLWVP